MTVDPSDSRVPAGMLSVLRSISRKSWSPASDHRDSSGATKAITRLFMMLSCMSGCGDPSCLREFARARHVSLCRCVAGDLSLCRGGSVAGDAGVLGRWV